MKNLFIDPTSKNNLFNSLEAQGSFIFHRFGKRPISEEHLDIFKLKNYIKYQQIDQIILESIFGDPLEYAYLEDLLSFCKKNKIKVIIITNGYSNKFEIYKKFDVTFIFNLYGYVETFNKFFPDCDFDMLQKNLEFSNKIRFNLYKENIGDALKLLDTYQDVEIVQGVCTNRNLNHIISIDGIWLYDVHGVKDLNLQDFSFDELSKYKDYTFDFIKSVEGYHLLKCFTQTIKGVSILDTNTINIKYQEQKDEFEYISYKGHIFKSFNERNIITNFYIDDWDIKLLDSANQEQHFMIGVLGKFSNNPKVTI